MSKQCTTHHFACDCREAMFKELERKVADQGLTIVTIEDIVTNDKHSDKAKVLAIQYVLRKEARPIRADHSGDINEMMQVGKEAQP